MSIDDAFTVAGALAITVLIIWLLPRVWRNERGLHLETLPPGWPLSLRLYRTRVRAAPFVAVATLDLFAVGGAVAILGEDSPGYSIWAVSAGVSTVVCFVWVVPVVLANCPRFLVAPHLCDQPGLLAEIDGDPPRPTSAPTSPPRGHRPPGR